MARDKPSFRTTTQTGRLLRLTGMTTSIASRVATHSVKKLFQSEEAQSRDREKLMRHIGREVASTLGEMKGAVMKVGQIASQMQDLLPDEIAEALSVLQKASAPMPFSVIRKQVRRELGDVPEALFARFDEKPFAAASIGQVHRATTHEGQDVVVKVQYPAVKESIDSDMRHLRRILRLGGLLKVEEATLDAIFSEIRNQLEEELDYRQEADNLRRFRAFHADQSWLIIPDVVDALSSDKVLTLTYESGDDMDTVRSSNHVYGQALRNQLGERLFDAIARQIFVLREVHCDPHPGNFAYRPDGSIVIYDFGAIKRIPEEDLNALRRLTQAGYAEDYAALEGVLKELGIRKSRGPEVSAEFYAGWAQLLLPPFGDQPFDFAGSRLHLKLAKKTRETSWKYLESFQPSARTLLVDRVLGGHYWTLVNLGVVASFRPKLEAIMSESMSS
ncbi:AarF/ABC1/UbiB kinase family protein [Alcanivorax sp. JB21]|uniref:ABC1 kinase family protein n=1 Tax=Alcanivorax limicola TaxID=2874102 RepID=UPI001CC08294|nr:AarF/ABC1/UbiB kinase family protein [Alcanivorax limicola]MBZ2190499.1 AarF/ABC1/UbiB kinase family protein [Alcanivorax limicola]